MKMLSLVLLTVLAATVSSLPARGEEPDASQVAKLTPQLQAMLNDLLKAADGDAAAPAPAAPVAPAAATAPPTTSSARPSTATSTSLSSRPSSTSLGSTSLHTSSLRTGHLGASASLSGAPRMNDDEWRQLFPQKK
jgi:hypothetical protein